MLSDEKYASTPEITDLIIHLKQSDFFERYGGARTLIADLLAMFLSTGKCVHAAFVRTLFHVCTGSYDARARALLKHMSALLALSWDTVTIVENSVTHLLVEETFVESV
jgi:hypothetical protein